MSNIKYGLISETDAKTLEKVIDIICTQNPGQEINTCEVGLYSGLTSKAIYEYVTSKGYGSASINPSEGTMQSHNYKCKHIGVDNGKDGEELRDFPKEAIFIKGNSTEVYNQIPDNSQHLVFIDALHTFPAVVADFFCYAPKVKVGGFLAFHDTGKHIDPLSQWQKVGDKNDPDMCLGGVRKALQTIGLLEPFTNPNYKNVEGGIYDQWELVFDEANPNDTAGGICVFKKLY